MRRNKSKSKEWDRLASHRLSKSSGRKSTPERKEPAEEKKSAKSPVVEKNVCSQKINRMKVSEFLNML